MKELGFVTPHKITIESTCNMGFLIQIGCARIVASSVKELLEIQTEYFHDPKGWEKKYNDLQPATALAGSDQPEEAPLREAEG